MWNISIFYLLDNNWERLTTALNSVGTHKIIGLHNIPWDEKYLNLSLEIFQHVLQYEKTNTFFFAFKRIAIIINTFLKFKKNERKILEKIFLIRANIKWNICLRRGRVKYLFTFSCSRARSSPVWHFISKVYQEQMPRGAYLYLLLQ